MFNVRRSIAELRLGLGDRCRLEDSGCDCGHAAAATAYTTRAAKLSRKVVPRWPLHVVIVAANREGGHAQISRPRRKMDAMLLRAIGAQAFGPGREAQLLGWRITETAGQGRFSRPPPKKQPCLLPRMYIRTILFSHDRHIPVQISTVWSGPTG